MQDHKPVVLAVVFTDVPGDLDPVVHRPAQTNKDFILSDHLPNMLLESSRGSYSQIV